MKTLAVGLTMRCWADIRLSQSDSGGMLLLIGWSSSRGGMLWSRLCRGSWGATSDSEFSSFSQDMRSWFTPSSPPSGVEANGEVACLEDMILLREEQRRHVSHKTFKLPMEQLILNKQSCKCQTENAGSQLSFCMRALRSHIYMNLAAVLCLRATSNPMIGPASELGRSYQWLWARCGRNGIHWGPS